LEDILNGSTNYSLKENGGKILDDDGFEVGYLQSDGSVWDADSDQKLCVFLPNKKIISAKYRFLREREVLASYNRLGDVFNKRTKRRFENRDQYTIISEMLHWFESPIEVEHTFLEDIFNGNFDYKLDFTGSVFNNEGNEVGKFYLDGNIKDTRFQRIVGTISHMGEVFDNRRKSMGYFLPEGAIFTKKNTVLKGPHKIVKEISEWVSDLSETEDNNNFLKDILKGKPDYKILPDGRVTDNTKNVVGQIESNGDVYNAKGDSLGHIESNGDVYNDNQTQIGHIGYDGYIHSKYGLSDTYESKKLGSAIIKNISNEDKNKNGDLFDNCFIATAVYGNINAPEVEILRDLRDNVLMQNKFGRLAVKIYYNGVGETMANLISNHLPSIIPVIRKGLDTLVKKYDAQKK